MALITTQQITQAGVVVSLSAMNASDTFINNGKTALIIANASGTTRTITIDSLVNCDQGVDHNLSISIVNGATKYIGPFEINRFTNSNGVATVMVDVAASVTIAAISL
jgi:hypothetical protein